MPEVTYTDVVWTSGDTITEAKLDNMVANDRAVDAMANGIELQERSVPATPGTNKLHLYVKDKSGVPTLYAINDAGTDYEISENRPTFVFTIVGTLVTGTSLTPILVATRTMTIVKAYANVKVAPTGASIIVDLNKNGSSIWGSTPANRLSVAAGATAGTQSSFDTTSLSEGDELTPDLDQVGSSVAGADITISVRCK